MLAPTLHVPINCHCLAKEMKQKLRECKLPGKVEVEMGKHKSCCTPPSSSQGVSDAVGSLTVGGAAAHPLVREDRSLDRSRPKHDPTLTFCCCSRAPLKADPNFSFVDAGQDPAPKVRVVAIVLLQMLLDVLCPF